MTQLWEAAISALFKICLNGFHWMKAFLFYFTYAIQLDRSFSEFSYILFQSWVIFSKNTTWIFEQKRQFCIKGELSSQLYPTFYCLEIKSLVIAFEQKKPRQKILLFGWAMVLQSWTFEPRSKNAKLGVMENVAPDDVIWGKMTISTVN